MFFRQETSKQPPIFHSLCEYDGDPRGRTATEAASWCRELSVGMSGMQQAERQREQGREGQEGEAGEEGGKEGS